MVRSSSGTARRPTSPMKNLGNCRACCTGWLMAILPLVVWLHGNAHGTMTFPSASTGPLHGASIYSPTGSSFVGPQPEDGIAPITGRMLVIDGDLCKPFPALNATGMVVLATVDAFYAVYCSIEAAYLNMVETGAVAYIWPALVQTPSVSIYWHDGSFGVHTRHLKMPFLAILPAPDVYQSMIDAASFTVNVTVYPDSNVWVPFLASWPYQLLIRVIPSCILLASGAFAAVFFVQHMAILGDRYDDSTTGATRSTRRRLRFVFSNFDHQHLVLFIEMTSATLAGLVLAVGGYHSTAHLPAPVTNYFTSLLGGWGFAASVLSALVWARKLSFIMPSADEFLILRVVRGDHRMATASLCVLPVLLDAALNTMFASYYFERAVETAGSTILFSFQLGISSSVLWILVWYYRAANRIQDGIVATVRSDERSVDRLLRRLTHCVLGMSISTLMFCLGTAILGIAPEFALQPSWGWIMSWATAFTGRALDSAFRVAMFKPRRVQQHKSAGWRVAPDTQ